MTDSEGFKLNGGSGGSLILMLHDGRNERSQECNGGDVPATSLQGSITVEIRIEPSDILAVQFGLLRAGV